MVLTPYVPEASAKMISVEEQKQITGAFFALILGVVARVAQVLITVITLAVATITAIVTVMSAIVSTVITAIANAVVAIGQGLIAFGKLAFAGVKFVAETLLKGLTSGFQFLKQGIMNFGKFLKFAGGPKFIAGALSPEHLIGRQVIGAALSIGTGKTLDKIGVDPTITRLTTAFITGGVIAPTAIGSLGPASAILGGSLRSLIVAGVNELALKIGLAPPIASGLSSISGILTGNILSGNPFSDVIPQLTGEIFSTGVQTLGQFYGIDPRLSALLGIPIGAVAGGVAGGLLQSGGPAGILNSVTQSLFSGATAGGLVGVGSAIALDKVGAPPIAREFVSSFLGQLTASLIQNASSNSGNQNTNSDLNEAGKSILSKVGDGIRKFGQGFAGAVGTVVNFGSRVVQGVGQFTANGFKQVLGSVATLFGQPTQQKIYEDQQGLSQGQVSVSGDVWRYKNGDSQIEYNAVSGEMTESSSVGGTARITGLGMDDAGSIYYQKLTYDSVVSGGAALSQTYDQGKITRISYGIEGTSVLTIQGPAKSNPNQEWIKADGTIVEGEIIIDAHPVMPGITNQGPSFNFLENFFLKLNIFGEKIAEASVGLQSGPSGVGSTSPLAKELFVLVNGIGNLTGASGPEYLRRLKYDVAAQSDPNNKVDAEKDVIPAPVFQVKGLMFKALSTLLGNQQKAQDAAKKLEDAMKVLTTQLAGGSGELSWEAQLGMQQFFNDKGVGNRLRPVVGVGYSGGFVPMVSAIVNEGLTPEAYVALGGATFGVGELLASVIVDVIKAMENVATERNDTTRKLLENAFKLLGATLKGVPGAVANATAFFLSKLDAFYNTIDKTTLDAKVNEFYNDLKQQVGNQTGFNWTTLANSGAKLVVNVWGDKDQLALGNAISGYLPEIGGYTPGDRNQPLFNIEIVGADHFDYIRGVRSADDYVTEYPDMTKRQEAIHRNEIVSGFVAQMISRAKDAQELRDFLTSFGPIVQQVGTDHYRVDLGV
ncbi:MAG: hypothetical protein HZC17_03050 [Candidatus Omnitrophica bacterium]|nr:hypothetical protein [Candidatus Omnitrophota bacterium]